MLNYQTDIQPLEQSGLNDAQILTHLSQLYHGDCMATGSTDLKHSPDLLHILGGVAKMLRIGSDATWKGPLIDYMDALDTNDANNLALQQGFELLLSQLQITGRVVFTSSNSETASLTTAITQIVKSLVDANPTIIATGDRVQSLIDQATGGGRRFPDGVTQAELDNARQDYTDSVTAQVQENRLINAKAFFAERMTAGGDADAIWAQAWVDAEA